MYYFCSECKKPIAEKDKHVANDPVDGRILFFHVDCCIFCPRPVEVA